MCKKLEILAKNFCFFHSKKAIFKKFQGLQPPSLDAASVEKYKNFSDWGKGGKERDVNRLLVELYALMAGI